MTVRELGARLDGEELAEWVARFALEREGDQQNELTHTVERELTRARQG